MISCFSLEDLAFPVGSSFKGKFRSVFRFAPDDNPVRYWKFQMFDGFIGVDWSLNS